MTDLTIEKVWTEGDTTCVAIINHLVGARNGYCSVSESNPLYKKSYKSKSISDLGTAITDVLRVHGGVTYSGDLSWAVELDNKIPKDTWWFGFDCSHYTDSPDPDLFSEPSFCEDYMHGVVRDLPYVVKECVLLADQLGRLAKNYTRCVIDKSKFKIHSVS